MSKSDRWQIRILLVILAYFIIRMLVGFCQAQTIGTTIGYNGSIYTTLEVVHKHKNLHTTAYATIPYFGTGHMMHQDRLWHYRLTGIFMGVRIQYQVNRLLIGTACQYERNSYRMNTIVSHHPDMVRDTIAMGWIYPVLCMDFAIGNNVLLGINVGRWADVHLRIMVDCKKQSNVRY